MTAIVGSTRAAVAGVTTCTYIPPFFPTSCSTISHAVFSSVLALCHTVHHPHTPWDVLYLHGARCGAYGGACCARCLRSESDIDAVPDPRHQGVAPHLAAPQPRVAASAALGSVAPVAGLSAMSPERLRSPTPARAYKDLDIILTHLCLRASANAVTCITTVPCPVVYITPLGMCCADIADVEPRSTRTSS